MYCYTWNCIYGYNNERERDDAKRIKEIKKKKVMSNILITIIQSKPRNVRGT